jgi:tryptophan synthase alpha chain
LLLVATVRRKTSIPIILMGYYNPFLKYGLERFTREAGRAGIDGVLVVDLPPEEAAEMKRFADRAGLDLIFLLAPTSGPKRIDRIVTKATGFIYYVSLTGVTGVRSTLDRTIRQQIETIRKKSSLPVGVGFGISTPKHAKIVAQWADAVVVGSAIIKIISECTSTRETLQKTGNFIRALKLAIE